MILDNQSNSSEHSITIERVSSVKIALPSSFEFELERRQVHFDEDQNQYYESNIPVDDEDSCPAATWYDEEEYLRFKKDTRSAMLNAMRKDHDEQNGFYAALRQMYRLSRSADDFIVEDAAELLTGNKVIESYWNLALGYANFDGDEHVGAESQLVRLMDQDARKTRTTTLNIVHICQEHHKAGKFASLHEMQEEMRDCCTGLSQSSRLFAQLTALARSEECDGISL